MKIVFYATYNIFFMQIHSTALGGFVIIQLAAVHIEHAAGLIHLAGLQIHSAAVGIAILPASLV